MRALQAIVDDGPAPTRSPLEDGLLDLLDRGAIERPEVNAALRLDGRRIVPDYLWRDRQLAIEADSRQWHEHSLTLDNDADKQAILEAHGWRVLRVSSGQVDLPAGADARADPRRARGRRGPHAAGQPAVIPAARSARTAVRLRPRQRPGFTNTCSGSMVLTTT